MSKQSLLDAFAPASVLVTRRYQVLYVYGDTSAYLAHPTGELTDDLLAMTRSELRLKTRAALRQAVGENRQVSLRGAKVRCGETVLPVTITVTPLRRPPGVAGLLLVSFRHEADATRQAPGQEPGRGAEAEMERQLQEELKTAQDELQSTIEELETTNEELKASNDVAVSVNEELETSKEELQSLNEELTTVNSQLQSKLAEVEDVNNDLANLLSSTNIATLFLDRELRIKRFTPATNRLMSLIPADIGRPVADIAPKFVDGDLQSDCRQVMETLYPVEREVQGQDGEWYIRRVQPYHSADQLNRRGRMAGTVVTFSNVTALKRREEEHARLASIVASSRDAITGETLDGIVTTWNPGAEALYGYRADEMLGHSSERLFHERLRSEFAHILAELRAGHPVGPYETERRRKDGTMVQVSVTHSPIRDHAGQVIAASTIARDITERVQAEAALRERVALQDQFSKVVATVPGVICSFRRRPDGSTAMPYASPMIKDLFGVEAQDVAADFGPIRDRIHPDDVSHVRDTIDQSARTMEPWRDAYRYRHPTKGEIWIEGHSVPTRELDGALLWHGYVHDITERKRAEKEIERLNQDLRQRLAELEAILDVSPIGIFLARDPGCKEMTANAAGSAMLGLPAGMNPSVTGPDAGRLPFRVFQQGKELAPDELPMQYAAAHNTGVTDFEALFVRSDGTKLNLLIYALPLHHDDGQVRGVLGMLVDITERKQMEQALRDKQADLERQATLLAEADRRKDEFLAVLGHELRNPLTPIRNAAHILARPEASPDQVSWAVDMICRQSEQLEQLVNDLLDVARITRGRIELRKSPLPVQDALADAIQSAAPTMEQRAQALEVQMPEVPLMVMADPMRLGQVFLNLLANAVKYTPNGGHIWIGLTQEGQTAVVRVRDDGIGILPEDRPYLFDFFSRGKAGHPDMREPDGLGVGLALSKQLTERHGGTLEAHSAGPGHGSEFVVTLPLVAPTASAPASAEPHLTPGALTPAHRILVVDDNRDVADSLAVLLTTMGHQVLALTAGRDAVAAIGDFRPDLVFLDIGMPDMDGYQVAAAIRALGLEPRPVLVALSGYRQVDKKGAVQEAGFDRHLLKPVGPDQIDALLADLG